MGVVEILAPETECSRNNCIPCRNCCSLEYRVGSVLCIPWVARSQLGGRIQPIVASYIVGGVGMRHGGDVGFRFYNLRGLLEID